MNSMLFLGYSNLLKSRILPILSLVDLSQVSIAKYQSQEWDEDYKKVSLPITLYDNYEDALKGFVGNIVYISTVNSTHYEYALKCLKLGFHVIVDKPATMTFDETQMLIRMAKDKHLLISESIVYLMHPQFDLIKAIFLENNDSPKFITAHFSMPPFKGYNFRYQKELGGGAILDTSPYAVSLGRYFFGDLPVFVNTVINEETSDNLEIQYSLLMHYPGGKCLIGHFGFNTEYVNEVFVMGTRTNIFWNRVFTIPDALENTINVTHENVSTVRYAPKGNNFELYLKKIMSLLASGDFKNLYSEMLYDAKARKMISDNIMNL